MCVKISVCRFKSSEGIITRGLRNFKFFELHVQIFMELLSFRSKSIYDVPQRQRRTYDRDTIVNNIFSYKFCQSSPIMGYVPKLIVS